MFIVTNPQDFIGIIQRSFSTGFLGPTRDWLEEHGLGFPISWRFSTLTRNLPFGLGYYTINVDTPNNRLKLDVLIFEGGIYVATYFNFHELFRHAENECLAVVAPSLTMLRVTSNSVRGPVASIRFDTVREMVNLETLQIAFHIRAELLDEFLKLPKCVSYVMDFKYDVYSDGRVISMQHYFSSKPNIVGLPNGFLRDTLE